jgi:hypothetical protein
MGTGLPVFLGSVPVAGCANSIAFSLPCIVKWLISLILHGSVEVSKSVIRPRISSRHLTIVQRVSRSVAGSIT